MNAKKMKGTGLGTNSSLNKTINDTWSCYLKECVWIENSHHDSFQCGWTKPIR